MMVTGARGHGTIRKRDPGVTISMIPTYGVSTMTIPSIFYGRYAVVVPLCRKLAKQMVQADSFDLFDPEPFVDSSQSPGLIFLDKAPPWRAEESHFRITTVQSSGLG